MQWGRTEGTQLVARGPKNRWAEMRSLLSINNYHYLRGGSEAVYFKHAEMFAAQGWEASFFSMEHDQNVPCADSQYFADCIDYAKGGSEGRTVSNALKIVYSIEARRKLAELLNDKKIDIAHIHSIYHHLSPSVLMELKARGIPAVMTVHDLKLACPNNKMLNRAGVCERCKGGHVWNAVRYRCIKDSFVASSLVALESAVHKMFGLYRHNLDRVVAPSRFYRDKLISWGFDPSWIVHIPNPVTLPETSIAPPGNYILYFGRLAPEKGLATLVRAAAHAKVPVRIVGGGPQEAELKGLAQQLSAPVEFLGYLAGESLWAQVCGARAVVLPSEWYENGPMSVIEAFARGKPLIGANIGGIPELIPGGETGWLFTSGDPNSLSGALGAAFGAPPAQLRTMGVAARSYATRYHSEAGYYAAVSALYENIGIR